MIGGLLALVVVALGFAAYYGRIHLEWRAEVRRRRAERERQRDFFAAVYGNSSRRPVVRRR